MPGVLRAGGTGSGGGQESATADSEGEARVAVEVPARPNTQTRLRRMAVTTSGTGAEIPELVVYRNEEQPTFVIDGTENGKLDVSRDNIVLFPGERLIFVVTGIGDDQTVGISYQWQVEPLGRLREGNI